MNTSRCFQSVYSLLIAAALLSGPMARAQTSSPPPSPVAALTEAQAQAQSDKKKFSKLGKVIGTGVGTIGGIFIANNQKNASDAEKAAIVAGAAAVGYGAGWWIGKSVGETVATRRTQYAQEQAFLESEIQMANAAIAMREQQLAQAQQDSEKRRVEIVRLESQATRTKQDIKLAKASLADVNKEIEENNSLLEQYKTALAYLEETLNSSTLEKTASAEERAKWEEKKKTLETKRAELVAQSQRLQGVGEVLEADKARLVGITAK